MGILVAWIVAAVAGAPQGPTSGAPSSEVHGRVEIRGTDGTVSPAVGAVVWLPGAAAAPTGPPPSMASQEKRFEPHVLVVPRGATVAFTNVDRVYHNVFSLSRPNEFDLGIYRKGAARSKRFESTGVVRVYCNIHPDMAGFVLVVDTNAFAVVGSDGSYRIAGLAPGRYKARVWDERGGERELDVDVAPGVGARLDVVLDASQWRPFRHKNKHGKDYPPVTKDADRY